MNHNQNHSELETLRHSCAHIMAQAVLSLYPGTKLAIGPSTEDGFYYDFDPQEKHKFSELDFPKIEARMLEIIKENQEFIKTNISKAEAIARFESEGEVYKLELVEGLEDGEITLFTNGPFTDLCRGPHLPSTGQIKAFKLLSVAGAYWRGSEKNPMLQRIYGTCFSTQEELDEYIHRLEEAKKRDHRKVGKDLKLFVSVPEIGPGLPVWLPAGATIRRTLERYITDLELRSGYHHVYTPVMAKTELYKISGHLEHYKDSMFPIMQVDEDELVLRPMCCPHHIQVYKSEGKRSYRELPLRIAELGNQFRFERSGELSGLSRVRQMCLNDAHIFCTEDHIKTEVISVLKLVEQAYSDLGLGKDSYTYRLSLRDPQDTEKYVNNPKMWEKAENELREVFTELGLPHYEAVGEAAFYGPKIDIQLKNVLGKEETVSTIQVDRHLPERFQLEYVGEDGQPHRPVMIHRGVISTMERMVSFLIEYYGGAFPVWFSPVQVAILPIKDSVIAYCQKLTADLQKMDVRVNLDDRNEKLGQKIRNAQLAKIPYMLVVGDREVQDGNVAVRRRDGVDLGVMPFDKFAELINSDIKNKTTSFQKE